MRLILILYQNSHKKIERLFCLQIFYRLSQHPDTLPETWPVNNSRTVQQVNNLQKVLEPLAGRPDCSGSKHPLDKRRHVGPPGQFLIQSAAQTSGKM